MFNVEYVQKVLIFVSIMDTLSNQESLFYYTHHILRRAKTIARKDAIILIGSTRSGKSTTFNWILDEHSLIGCGDQQEAIYNLNWRKYGKSNFADVKDGYKSVTLTPNIKEINIKEINKINRKVCLIDFPGFKDTRTENEVMLIKYAISTCLNYTENATFVIIITEKGFTSMDGNQFIRSFKEFIYLFDFKNMSPQQRLGVYHSVGLLITSVSFTHYESKKASLLRRMEENLRYLSVLKESNAEIKQIYEYLEQLIKELIQHKRFQIFEKAKNNESPKKSQMINTFFGRGWKMNNLQNIRPYLNFSYQREYKNLSASQKQSLEQSINNKSRQYATFVGTVFTLVQHFLKNFTLRQSDMKNSFQVLMVLQKQKKNLYGDVLQFQGNQNQKCNTVSPILIIETIRRLMNGFINFDYDREQEDKKKRNYLQYLQQFFKKQMQEISCCFCKTQKQKFILNNLTSIYEQMLQQFTHLAKMDPIFISTCQNQIREGISISNYFLITQKQLILNFMNQTNKKLQIKNTYKADELKKIISMIDGCQKLIDLCTIKYELLFKLNKWLRIEVKNQRLFAQTIERSLTSFIYWIIWYFSIESQHKYNLEDQSTYPQVSISKIKQKKCKILQQIWEDAFQIPGVNYEAIYSIYSAHHFYREQQKILDSTSIKNLNGQYIKWMKIRAQFYQKMGDKTILESIYRQLEDNDEIIDDQAQSQWVRNRIMQISTAPRQFWLQKIKKKTEMQTKSQQPENVALFIDQMWKCLFPNKEKLNYRQICSSIQARHKQQNNNAVIQSQFSFETPAEMRFHQIATFSKYLIAKINQRKVIIMIGFESAGRTTICYTLRNKLLVQTYVNGKLQYQSSDKNKEIDRIHNQGKAPTEIPNIYNIQDGSLLIDLSNIHQSNPEKLLLHRSILQQIIQNCSACKFLFVVKEEDIIKKDCTQFMKLLRFYCQLFPSITDENIRSLAFIFSFPLEKQKDKNMQARVALNKLRVQFQSGSNSQIQKLEQRYQLSRHQTTNCLILMQEIFLKTKYVTYHPFLQKNNNKQIIKDFSNNRNWRYTQNPITKIHKSLAKDCLKTREDIKIQFMNTIKDHFLLIDKIQKIIQQLIHKRMDNFVKLAQNNDESQKFGEFYKLVTSEGGDYLTKTYLQIKNKKITKNIQFPNMQFYEAIKTPQIAMLALFLAVVDIQGLMNSCYYFEMQQFEGITNKMYPSLVRLCCKDADQLAIFEKAWIFFRMNLQKIMYTKRVMTNLKQIRLNQSQNQQLQDYNYQLAALTTVQHKYAVFIKYSHQQIYQHCIKQFRLDLFQKQIFNPNQKICILSKSLNIFIDIVTYKLDKLDKQKQINKNIIQQQKSIKQETGKIKIICKYLSEFNQKNKDNQRQIILDYIYQYKIAQIEMRMNNKRYQFQSIVRDILGNIAVPLSWIDQNLAFQISSLLNSNVIRLKIYEQLMHLKYRDNILHVKELIYNFTAKFMFLYKQNFQIDESIWAIIRLYLRQQDSSSMTQEIIKWNNQIYENNSRGRNIAILSKVNNNFIIQAQELINRILKII